MDKEHPDERVFLIRLTPVQRPVTFDTKLDGLLVSFRISRFEDRIPF